MMNKVISIRLYRCSADWTFSVAAFNPFAKAVNVIDVALVTFEFDDRLLLLEFYQAYDARHIDVDSNHIGEGHLPL